MTTSEDYVTKTCPHCGKSFVCKNHDILNCQCVEVRLTREVRQRIAELYEDCLCLDCLHLFAEEGLTSKTTSRIP